MTAIKIEVGFDLTYQCLNPTPMMVTMNVHPSRERDLVTADTVHTDPPLPLHSYVDGFGNRCARLVAPAGFTRFYSRATVNDSREPDPYVPMARQVPVEYLPDDVLVFLLGSRYCDTDRLAGWAWQTFGNTIPGWGRVQAVCDWVHNHIRFDYQNADPTRTAYGAFELATGVCRDFTHLAVAALRCLNIPARYCTGYIPDIDVPPVAAPMDFCAWLEVYLDGIWYPFDPRNNTRRVGRILMARGRDATDVAISNTFGSNLLTQFTVYADQVY
jgi:transglutaminase-like putative cysteine protease